MGAARDCTRPDLTAAAVGRERAFFDHYVEERGDFEPFADRAWATLRDRFGRWVRPKRPLRLLDVGCGTGASLALYAPFAGEYVGLDLSGGAIDRARERHPDREWVVGDACDLPFGDETFDAVAFSSVLHHLPAIGPALREAFRVLRPGGHVFAFDPHLLHPAMALFRWPRSPLYRAEGVSPNESPLPASTLRREFLAAGFTGLRQRGQSDLPYRAVAVGWMNAALRLYNFGDWLWERVGLGRWLGTFLCTAARKPGR